MEGHRFEIGECVTYIEKRFPNGVRHTQLMVIEQLTGPGEPQYQLRSPDGFFQYVLAESQVHPSRRPTKERGASTRSRPMNRARDASRRSA